MNYLQLEEHYFEIEKMYLEDSLTPAQIGEKFGSKRYQINYLLEKHGIQKSVSQAKRKYSLNEDYFDEIDTPNKAYILGFLYADGYNNRINNTVVLSLNREDREILEKISKEVGSTKPLFESNYTPDDGVERHMLILAMASKHMCESVEKWGLTQNKTFTITFPNFLEDELIPHFIRGYFDGDGCACVYCRKDTRQKSIATSIMSSVSFCEGLLKYLKNKEIYFCLDIPKNHEQNGIVRSHSMKENKKFMNLIYKDADLYLTRKLKKFQEFYK